MFQCIVQKRGAWDFVANVFDTKVVDAQIKPDRAGDVLPKTGCVFYFEVAMSSQVLA